MIRKHHRALALQAVQALEACVDNAVLCDWIVKASELDTPAFARLLGIE